MNLHINAEVFCREKFCGKTVSVIINPGSKEITHLGVKESHFPYIERLVSIKNIKEANAEKIVLECSTAEFAAMENFIEYDLVPGATPLYRYEAGEFWMPSLSTTALEHEQVFAGESAVHHGVKVFNSDGHIGKVDDFLIGSRTNGRITHLVLREWHLWAAKNITVPISEIKEIDDDGIHLNLSEKEIESLPSIKADDWFN